MSIVENTLGSAYNQLLYLSGQNSASLKIADAVRMFNYAINDYNLLARQNDRKWITDDTSNTTTPDTTINLVGGTAKYLIDSDHLDVISVHVLNSTTGLYSPLIPLTGHDDQGEAHSTAFGTSGTPTHYTLDGNYITVYPTPSTSLTAGLKPFLARGISHIASTNLATEIGIMAAHMGYLVFNVLNQMGIRTTKATGQSVPLTLQKLEDTIAKHLRLRGGGRNVRFRSNSRAIR